MIVGAGIRATGEGAPVIMGTPILLANTSIGPQDAEQQQATTLQERGEIVILVARQRAAIGLFAVVDRIEQTSAAIDDVRHTTVEAQECGIQMAMLTRDNHHTGQAVGQELHIPADRVGADVLPAGTANHVTRLQDGGEGSSGQWRGRGERPTRLPWHGPTWASPSALASVLPLIRLKSCSGTVTRSPSWRQFGYPRRPCAR